MEPQTGLSPALDNEQLLHLRDLTKDVSKLCRAQLRDYLDALAPLFRPRRILGDHVEGPGREGVLGADQNFSELRELFLKVGSRPFELRPELASPLESVNTQIQIHEWEYAHEVHTERERKIISVVSPLTWVLAYPSTYTFPMMRQMIAAKQDRDQDSVHSFVLRACIMYLMFAKSPTLASLFAGLRFNVEIRKSPHLGELPFVTVSAPFRTVRPSDDLTLMATRLSGRTVFEEVLDRSTGWRIPDPMQERVAAILREHGES